MSIRTREVRELAVQTYQQGGRSLKAVAGIFKIHYQTLRNWLKVAKAGGEQVPRPRGHRRASLQSDDLTRIKSYIMDNPSATCDQIKTDLGLSCCITTVSLALRKLNFTRKKKTLKATEQERPDVKQRREDWKIWMGKSEADRLIFLDETGIKTNFISIYGWSQRNTRCVDSRPAAYKSSTIISAIRLSGVLSSTCIEGSLNKQTFSYYMEKILFPCLDRGDIVIMDNLSVHKNSFDISKFSRKNISIKYLPPYSPEYNPIENMWSKFKQIVRTLRPRSFDAISDAMNNALDKITTANIAGWFRGCGYA